MENCEVVSSCFETFFSGPADHSEVRVWLTDDFVFTGPLMSAESADGYV